MNYLTKIYRNYNHTYQGQRNFFFPKNTEELIHIFKILKKKKIKPLIISGSCGYGDKSFLKKNTFIINLKKFDKFKKINLNKKFIIAQSGVNLSKLSLYLDKKKHFLFNIPGGKNVSIGGAISGNVHGRPQNKKFSSFGDNVLNLKILDKNLKIKTYTRKNINFKNIIGSFGSEGIILEAKIKIHNLKDDYLEQKQQKIYGKKNFLFFDKNHKSYYGILDYFNKKEFFANFVYFAKTKKKTNKSKREFRLFKYINFFKLDKLISFIINKYTLKILYFFLFYTKKNLSKSKIIPFWKSLYFENINNYLPFYFKDGMIEIQFSVEKKKLFKIIDSLKKIQNYNNVYPIFFILKKMEKSSKKYFLNFPLYNHSISLGYSKRDVIKNKTFFKKLYKLLFYFRTNIYLTKDETILDFCPNFKNKIKKKITNDRLISNSFYEKVFK